MLHEACQNEVLMTYFERDIHENVEPCGLVVRAFGS